MKTDRRSLIRGAGALALGAALPLRGMASAEAILPMSAPVHVGSVGLRVRDAETLAAWYRDAVGLRELSRDGTGIVRGAGLTPLLTLTEQPGLDLAPGHEAGLFHTAFLLPSRADLARWITMAATSRLPVSGVADHRVSEAIYLTDPEGNGVEIYADRPEDSWRWVDGEVQMGTYSLDIESILAEIAAGGPAWRGAPADTRVGHVHLKVGNAPQAGRWWREEMGFDAVSSSDSAVFLSTGGYHHHVAVNAWMSAGAGRRSERLTGLDHVLLVRRDPGAETVFEDDWGTVIRLA